MLKGPRFIWLNWSDGLQGSWEEKDEQVVFKGKASVYKQLGDIYHTRTIALDKHKHVMTISDSILGAAGKPIRQLWHLDPALRNEVRIHSSSKDVVRNESQAYFSPTYGVMENGLQIEFTTTNDSIITQISFT